MEKGKVGPTRSFRAWPENQERLEYAEQTLGIGVSQVINEILNKNLKTYLQRMKAEKDKQFRKALDTPVP